MKMKILALGLVLALVAVMALPMAVFADTGGTNVTGTLSTAFTLTSPSSFIWTTNAGALVLGANTGLATAGSVVTNVAGWQLTVSDAKTPLTTGYMTIGGVDSGAKLVDPIQVGMTSGTLTTIQLYSGQLIAYTGTGSGYYGNIGTFIIPLFASQTVVGTDAAGAYSVTLTYTATPH
jgi:hypothetical protein